ncbi:YvcK family protein [Aminivibrio sp.]
MEVFLSYGLGLFTGLVLYLFFRLRERGGLSRRTRQFRGGKTAMKRAIEYRLSMGPFVVAIGGGTGLSSLLRGLKSFTRNIVAVVTVTDEGGSSGRLREEWGVLPPGDVRNCIVALAENDNALKKLLDFRFDRGGLAGHNLGNLMLLAISEQFGDFRLAVEEMNHLLPSGKGASRDDRIGRPRGGDKRRREYPGRTRPSERGKRYQKNMARTGGRKTLPDVLRSIDGADVIVLGPGSLFTSILPNLLIPSVAERLRRCPIPKVYIANLMTQPGETESFSIYDHVKWIASAMGSFPDYVVVNDGSIPAQLLEKYRQEGGAPLS